jgi:hypothetical protein
MNVFISYGSVTDQVTALRLQALASVNGLTVYVPPADTRLRTPAFLDQETSQKLNITDVILGVVDGALTEACRQELNSGIELHKGMIVMASMAVTPQLRPYFDANLVTVDPANPAQTEASIVGHLTAMNAEKNAQKALLALGTLALGLFIFALAAKD